MRFWLDDRFEAFAARLARHHADFAILPSPWGIKPPPIQRFLVKTTALLEKFENIPPLLAGEVMRAVSDGDLDVLFEALGNMFEHDRSAARGEMATRKLVVFRHATVDRSALPDGVEVIER